MPLIKNGKEAADSWALIEDGADVPASGDVVVTLSRLLAEGSVLLARKDGLGARLKSADKVEDLTPFLSRLGLIEIEFPAFRDGRGYSSARLLRERFKYAGELRAVGDVLHDQLFFMARCGFDAFLTPKAGAEEFKEALRRFHVVYQPAADGRTPVGRVRAQAAE